MNIKEKLVVGSNAQLISGSAQMTIEKIENDNADCVWFDFKEQKFKRESFKIELLVPTKRCSAVGMADW